MDSGAPNPAAFGKTSLLLGLLIAPFATLLAGALFPRWRAGDSAAPLAAFACAALTSLASLAVAASALVSTRLALALGGAGGLAVLASAWLPQHVATVALVNAALVTFAHALGGSIGLRVAHPGHLLPACAVAAAADLASVLHPAGPSRAIAGSEKALSLVAVSFPIPGHDAVAPSIGLGDLVFFALALGVSVRHGLSVLRTALLGILAVGVAGALAYGLRTPVPALVPMAVCLVIGLPEARAIRPEDRRTTGFAVAIAVAVVIAVGANRLG